MTTSRPADAPEKGLPILTEVLRQAVILLDADETYRATWLACDPAIAIRKAAYLDVVWTDQPRLQLIAHYERAHHVSEAALVELAVSLGYTLTHTPASGLDVHEAVTFLIVWASKLTRNQAIAAISDIVSERLEKPDWSGRTERLLEESLSTLRSGLDPLPLINAAESACRISTGDLPADAMDGYPFPGEDDEPQPSEAEAVEAARSERALEALGKHLARNAGEDSDRG